MNAQAYRPSHQGHPTPEKPWKVHVYVAGHHSGNYAYCTSAMALAHAGDSKRRFGPLRCAYRVEGPGGLAWSDP